MRSSSNAINRAKSLLRHYFQLALPKWDGDNASEIDEIVDEIMDAVEIVVESAIGEHLSREHPDP